MHFGGAAGVFYSFLGLPEDFLGYLQGLMLGNLNFLGASAPIHTRTYIHTDSRFEFSWGVGAYTYTDVYTYILEYMDTYIHTKIVYMCM